jgi:hypothetical protein
MKAAFAPDLFSGSRPVWKQVSPSLGEIVRGMDEFLPADYLSFCQPPEQIGGLEINSNNIRLTSTSGCQIVLKRYSDAVNISELHKTLDLMAWLADEGLPVPKPLPFSNGNTSISHAGRQWVLFPFVEGEYFSGSQEELDAVAETVGVLSFKLSAAPASLRTTRECHHFTKQDIEAIEFVESNRDLWVKIFGFEIAELLGIHWENSWEEWSRIRKNPLDAGPKAMAHLDLHPFNILVKDGKIVALLDFDSCKMMPIDYALAFGALKQCRQAVARCGDPEMASFFGSRYVEVLVAANPQAYRLANSSCDLALAEVFRRIALIFRLNIESSETRWNMVLPVQLAHIAECKALFQSP